MTAYRIAASGDVTTWEYDPASGLLSAKMHGPPVRPPRPKLGLTAAFGSGKNSTA